MRPSRIAAFLDDSREAALVRVASARGSTPRATDAWMLVSAEAMIGTIGGGQLEYMAIDEARAMLARGEASGTLDVPLGHEIGQCCGGRALLSVTRVDEGVRAGLLAEAEAAQAALPVVHVFGAGHVGRALVAALGLLPVRAVLIDQRPAEMRLAPAGVETDLTPLPEEVVRRARPGSAFVVMTHDHALDFLIVREALARGDAAYVGMIGSRTKRVSFTRWLKRADQGQNVDPGALVCPIGAGGRPDKRPEVIAAFVAAEIMARMIALQPVEAAAPGRTG